MKELQTSQVRSDEINSATLIFLNLQFRVAQLENLQSAEPLICILQKLAIIIVKQGPEKN